MLSGYSQSLLDRAHEWVGEHYPNLTGPAFEKALAECAQELSVIDAEADAAFPQNCPNHK